MFLSHRTARFYFRKLAQHTIPQHMNSTRSAILLYIELALVLEDEEEEDEGLGRNPQQGPGAEPLVTGSGGQSPLKLKEN